MSRKAIDVKRLMQARANRDGRLGLPVVNCMKAILQCTDAGELLVEKAVDSKVAALLERAVVISTVTAVEVYFRDTLATIFRVCVPEFFDPHVKQLFPEKFDISDLVELHRNKIDPLDVVLASQSFQNLDRINKIFSRFLVGGDLSKTIVGQRVRKKGDLSEGVAFEKEYLEGVERTFGLRHELVHDPARHSFFNEAVLSDIWSTGAFVFHADISLMRYIGKNLRPEFRGNDKG